MRRAVALAAALWWLLLPVPLPAAPPAAGGLTLPGDATVFSLGGRNALAAIESQERRVVISRADASGRFGPWSALPLSGMEAPEALASDETGSLLVVGRTGRGHALLRFRDGAPEGRPVELALTGKREITGAAAGNGILWLALKSPPGLLAAAYDGQPLVEPIALDGMARAPFSVALDPAGRAYVTDPMGPAVLVFSASGKLEGRRDLAGTGVTRPTGVAVDGRGRVWLSDGVTGRVVELMPVENGAVVRRTEHSTRYDDPLRLAADPGSGGGVWVLEGRAGRLVKAEETER